MSYKTILVHLELGRPNNGLLAIAGQLAHRLQASVLGVAVCQPIQILYDGTYVSGQIFEEDRQEIQKEMTEAESQFRRAFEGRAEIIDWRTDVSYSPLCDYVAHQARAADLVITGTDIGGSMFDSTRRVNIADLVMQAGRPVLIVPGDRATIELNRIVVGWKGTRESRLAVMEALPLLKLAHQINVVEIAPAADMSRHKGYVDDVVAWLKRHEVNASAAVIPTAGEDGQRLADYAAEQHADLIVAGAYGHSRVREWALGGVTEDFLLKPNLCVLVGH